MDTQTQAQIYLSEQRGLSQIDYFRSFHSFNFGHYFDENRKPFGSLQVLNDDTLQAGRSIRMQLEENTDVVIIPIVGGLEYQSSVGNGFLEAGQVQTLSLTSGMSYEISNPYETELINFIQIWLTNTSSDFTAKVEQSDFNVDDKNKLLPLFSISTQSQIIPSFIHGLIGKYDGRQDGVYQVEKTKSQSSGIFVFILSGVFEVQNILLHERDGLALMNLQQEKIEFEALSNEAILLLMEIPLKN